MYLTKETLNPKLAFNLL